MAATPALQQMWQNKWTKFNTKNVQPVWHAKSAHTLLVRHLTDLVGAGTELSKESKSILVPLCGKTVDMVHMQQLGCSVVGVDIVPNAMTDFRAETSDKYKWLEPQAVKEGMRHSIESAIGGARLELFRGDFFNLEALSALSGQFDYCLDRAGLAALPPTLHERYAGRIEELLKPGGRLLLIVYEFDEVRRRRGECNGWLVEVRDVGLVYVWSERKMSIGMCVNIDDGCKCIGWFVVSNISNHPITLFRLLVQSQKLVPSAPPFSFTQQDVGKLFGEGFTIKQLSRQNIFDSEPRWKTKGLKVC